MKLLYLRIRYFFDLWGSDYYGERIDASFAWALACASAEHDDELRAWEPL
jgi:hypothetical protein